MLLPHLDDLVQGGSSSSRTSRSSITFTIPRDRARDRPLRLADCYSAEFDLRIVIHAVRWSVLAPRVMISLTGPCLFSVRSWCDWPVQVGIPREDIAFPGMPRCSVEQDVRVSLSRGTPG